MRAGPLLLAAALLPLAACADTSAWLAGEPPPAAATQPAGAQVGLAGRGTWRGDISRAQSPTFLVARTDAEWRALWDLVGERAPGAMPENLMALAVFLGSRNSSGWGVEIVDIRVDRRQGRREQLLAEYREIRPTSEQFQAQVLTSPWAITLVDRSDFPVRYGKAE
ncbi:MAG TPA: protease complex subunit PrcB family protein [Azospirillaceae bacterium]|nr:protease complex subunit PrcB family protein [Azospirillaceae bacterium]